MDAVLEFLRLHYWTVARFIFAALALLFFIQLARRLLYKPKTSLILAVLDINDGVTRLPITHYEITIGRSRACDVVIPLASVSRQHAVLTMTEAGLWRIRDTGSVGGIFVNGEKPKPATLIGIGDEIVLAGVNMLLMPATRHDAKRISDTRADRDDRFWGRLKRRMINADKKGSMVGALMLLSLFQIGAFFQFFLTLGEQYLIPLIVSFGAIFVLPWLYSALTRLLGVENITAEIGGFFLTTIGLCATAGATPGALYKQLGAIVLGLIIFLTLTLILRNLPLVMRLRPWIGGLSLLILIVNLLIGSTINGQRNWVDLGFMTIQPSEFVKILFIFTGAATLEWLLTTKNLTALMLYATACIGLLFVMGDFGTALIFFFTFIVLIFLTSGDLRAIVLTLLTAALGAAMIVSYKPYIVKRFSAWRHVWQHVNDNGGYQQTRALMAIASGGLLGLGGGKGFLKTIAAADTDLVFAVLCEQWGLIVAGLSVGCYLLFLLSAIRSHRTTRSSYYVIAACAAAALFVFQASLNIFGTVDILPITGVTLPFISNGGSSMAASWGLLSFIAAALNNVRPKADASVEPVVVGGN